MKEKSILCIIPARGGSKGLPGKNIKIINGLPLIHHSINIANESKLINKVLVSTDCENIARIAEKTNCEIPFLRPSAISQNNSKDLSYIKHAIEFYRENENYIPELIVILRPTTPIRDVKIVDDAIKFFINHIQGSTSLRSAHEAAESPFKWFRKENDYFMPLTSDVSLEDTNNPRQDFAKVYIPNGYVDIVNPKIIEKGDLYGDKILSYITPTTYEIDTLEDFNYIKYLMEKQTNE